MALCWGTGLLLGTEDSAPTINVPTIEVVIDFIGLRPMRSVRARVAAGRWFHPMTPTYGVRMDAQAGAVIAIAGMAGNFEVKLSWRLNVSDIPAGSASSA